MDAGLTCECDLQYVVRDHEIVDYAPYCHSPSGLWIRGPDPFPLNTSPFVVCLGAAQTFGPFCKRPFPRVLQQALGIPVVNFGYPGAGPAFRQGGKRRRQTFGRVQGRDYDAQHVGNVAHDADQQRC